VVAPVTKTDGRKVNILVVDDLPDKRLAFQVVLEELGQNLVMAGLGRRRAARAARCASSP
jgi:CheY-like chemotaxis protein